MKKRDEVIKVFLEELKKVPNREVCQVATKAEIERISEELDFEKVDDIFTAIMNNGHFLDLSVAEVPKEFHFEMVLYFILMTEVVPEKADFQVWNFGDPDTLQFIQNVAITFGFDEEFDPAFMYLDDFLYGVKVEDVKF